MKLRIASVSLVLVAAVVVALAPRLTTGIREWRLDGVHGLVNGAVVGEDTAWAAGYTASGFSRVEPGMTEVEVRAFLGPPLERSAAERADLGWDLAEAWSRSPGDTHYRMRRVFYAEGRVVTVKSGFYTD